MKQKTSDINQGNFSATNYSSKSKLKGELNSKISNLFNVPPSQMSSRS